MGSLPAWDVILCQPGCGSLPGWMGSLPVRGHPGVDSLGELVRRHEVREGRMFLSARSPPSPGVARAGEPIASQEARDLDPHGRGRREGLPVSQMEEAAYQISD